MMACEKSSSVDDRPSEIVDPMADWVLLGVDTVNRGIRNYSMELFAKDSLVVGVNDLALRVKENGDVLTNLSITPNLGKVKPSGVISTPVSFPMLDNTDRVFKNKILFREDTEDYLWSYEVAIEAADTSFNSLFILEVAAMSDTTVLVFEGDDQLDYLVGFQFLDKPIVGNNEFDMYVYQIESDVSFIPEETWIVGFEPTMPMMGHGSDGNVNPVSSGFGRYRGEVNLSMPGMWWLNFDFYAIDSSIVELNQKIEVNF